MSMSSKRTIMYSVVSLLGFAGVTTTVAVDAISNNYHTKLFGRNQNNWIIRKEDLEKEGDTFYKVTDHNNVIGFSKSNNSIRNITPLTGLESVTLISSNSYLQISTGYREDSFLYEKYVRNDGSNEFNISLLGECYIEISSMDEELDADGIDITYTCSMNTDEVYDSNLEFSFDSVTSSYSVKINSSVDSKKVKSADIPMYFDDGENGKHSVTTIEYEGFYNCTTLEWLSIPSSITSIGSRSFYQCFALNNLYIPDGVTRINNRSFYRCNKLSNLRLPETLTSLDDYAFYYAGGLNELHLPNSIASVGSSCFV